DRETIRIDSVRKTGSDAKIHVAFEWNPYVLHADCLKVDDIGTDARVQRSNCRQVNGIDDTAPDQIRIAENQCVRPLIQLSLRARQNVLAVVIPRLILAGSHVTHQHGMILALLVIDAADGQILAGTAGAAEGHQAAGIVRFGEARIIHERESYWRKQ